MLPLSKRSQGEIQNLLGFSKKGWNPTETLEYKGTYNGWPVTYRKDYAPGEAITIDEVQGATAWLESNGIKPLGTPASMPDTRSSYAPPAQAPLNTGYAQPQQGGGWQCPIHGTQKIKPGYQGRGWECGVTSLNQPAYRYRQWANKQGEQMYTCSERSA